MLFSSGAPGRSGEVPHPAPGYGPSPCLCTSCLRDTVLSFKRCQKPVLMTRSRRCEVNGLPPLSTRNPYSRKYGPGHEIHSGYDHDVVDLGRVVGTPKHGSEYLLL